VVSRQPPWRDGKLHVLSGQCATCVFRAGNPMDLAPGRMRDLVESNLDAGAALTCHKTLSYGEHPELGEALCHGFLAAYGERVVAVRLARALELVELVPPPA
jgi:hypothetical protein